MKRTLVIGNGFDLDVGLKTRYIDFAESKWWPFKDARLQDCKTVARHWPIHFVTLRIVAILHI